MTRERAEAIRDAVRALAALFVALVPGLVAGDDYETLLERLRKDDPGAYEKVQRLDRPAALQFLRARYEGAAGRTGSTSPKKGPDERATGGKASEKSGAEPPKGALAASRDRYEVRTRLVVGAATIEVADEGLGAIEIAGVPIRSRDGLRRFGATRYVSHDEASVRWDGATTAFEAVDETFGGARFRGFKETWTFRQADPFRSVALRGSYELGGTTEGASANDGLRGWPDRPQLRTLPAADAYASGKSSAGKHTGTGFAFQHSGASGLVQFFGVRSADGRVVGDLLQQGKAGGDPRLEHRWELVFEPSTEIALPPFWNLLVTGPADPVSAWSVAHEFVSAKLHEEVGLDPTAPLPGIAWPVFSRDHGFAETATRCLPTTATEGFRLVLLDTIWRPADGAVKNMVTGDLVVAPEYGGVAGLRRLVDACHARGLEVVAWAPAGHLQGGERFGDAPIFRAHPDWKAKGRDGRDFLYMGDLQWGEFHGPFRSHLEESLLRVLRETGLDGFWLDSFYLAANLACVDEGGARPNADAILTTVLNLRSGGAKRLLAEGACAFAGYSTWGFKPPGPDFDLFDGSMILADYSDPTLYVDRYFQTCAARAPWIVPYGTLYGGKVSSPAHDAARERIRATNRLYEAHREQMRFRRRTELGYAYADETGRHRVFWALSSGDARGFGRVEAGRVVATR